MSHAHFNPGYPGQHQDTVEQVVASWRSTGRINVPTRKQTIASLIIFDVKVAKTNHIDYLITAGDTVHSERTTFAVVFGRGESPYASAWPVLRIDAGDQARWLKRS